MPLYVVSRLVEAVVYAKDDREARDAEVDPLPLRLPEGWGEGSRVYKRDRSTDLTVAEARKLP